MADQGYEADHCVTKLYAAGTEAVMPPRSNRLELRNVDRLLYRDRHWIAHYFARLRPFRRIATRYDQLAKSFLAFLHLADAFLWLA